MADSTSIFYQIGEKVKGAIADQATALLADANTWTGTNDFEKAVTVEYTNGTALEITGTASTSGKLTAESLESTGDTDAKGDLSVAGNATISKDLTVNGNLIVSGTEAIIDADSLDVTDNIVKLSDGASAGAYAKDSGLYFERGSGKPASAFVFDESEESFVVGTLEGTIAETLNAIAGSVTLITNSDNEVTSIAVVTQVPNYPPYTFNYIATSASQSDPAQGVSATLANTSDFNNTSTGLGGKKFVTKYQIMSGLGSSGTIFYIEPKFSNGEIVSLTSYGQLDGENWVSYDFSNAPTGSNADIANTTPAPLTVGSLKLVGPVSLTTSDAVITFTTSSGAVNAIIIDGVTHQAAVSLTGSTTHSPALNLNFLNKDSAYGHTNTTIGIVFEGGELVRITSTNTTTNQVTTYGYSDASPQELGNLEDFNSGFTAGA